MRGYANFIHKVLEPLPEGSLADPDLDRVQNIADSGARLRSIPQPTQSRPNVAGASEAEKIELLTQSVMLRALADPALMSRVELIRSRNGGEVND